MTLSQFNPPEIDITLDPVVEEVRERGRNLTQRYNNDPKKLFERLIQMAKQHPHKVVGQVQVVAIPQSEVNK